MLRRVRAEKDDTLTTRIQSIGAMIKENGWRENNFAGWRVSVSLIAFASITEHVCLGEHYSFQKMRRRYIESSTSHQNETNMMVKSHPPPQAPR